MWSVMSEGSLMQHCAYMSYSHNDCNCETKSLASLHEGKQKGHKIAVNLHFSNPIYSSFYFKACVILCSLPWECHIAQVNLGLIVTEILFSVNFLWTTFVQLGLPSLTDAVAYVQVYRHANQIHFFLLEAELPPSPSLCFFLCCLHVQLTVVCSLCHDIRWLKITIGKENEKAKRERNTAVASRAPEENKECAKHIWPAIDI